MTTDELAGWVALYEIDPWGERRADIREAVIGSAILAPWCKQSISASALIPDYDQERDKKIDQREGLLAWQAFVIEHNARQKA
jgi:hypothetical protein